MFSLSSVVCWACSVVGPSYFVGPFSFVDGSKVGEGSKVGASSAVGSGLVEGSVKHPISSALCCNDVDLSPFAGSVPVDEGLVVFESSDFVDDSAVDYVSVKHPISSALSL